MGYVVFHMQKTHGTDSGTSAHIERKVKPSNADEERTHLNRRLVDYPDGVHTRTQAIQHRLETAGITRKVGKNQVRAIRIMLSGSPDDMQRIVHEGRLDEWCTDNMKYLAATFGKENIVSADLHLDETSPHIHATLVPIVTTERKRKKQEEHAAKRYRMKSATRPRLCADEVMSRVKLKEYQDTYAEAMSKYGLKRGIEGSEARHVDTQQFYREMFARKNEIAEQVVHLKEQRQTLTVDIATLEARHKSAQTDYEAIDERRRINRQELEQAKRELTKTQVKRKASEATNTVLESIVSLFDDSKLKRSEREILSLKQENIALKNQTDTLKSTIQQLKNESTKAVQELRNEIAHLHDLLPELKELLRIEKICHAVRFGAELTKRIMRGESVGFKGSLYSPERAKWLHTDHSTAKAERDIQAKGRMRLTVDGIDVFNWLDRKYEEQYPRPLIKEQQRPTKGIRR